MGRTVKYGKPHLNYQDQLKLLASRGMDVGDERDGVAALKRIGYYRLSAYTYVFREPAANGGTGTSRRSDTFIPGTTLDHAIALHDFDHRFRRTLLDGLQQLEVGFRVKVSYRLGMSSAFGHLDTTYLDANRCAGPPSRPSSTCATAFDSWREEYDSLQRKAANEDYVKHFIEHYDGEIPIWAACEFMTMGCLLSLYHLMTRSDRKRIAEDLGVKDPQVLDGWLRALNVERNHCAHNARIWNRSTVYPPDRINGKIVQDELHHLTDADQHKVYFLTAVIAYLLKQINSSTPWHSDLKTTMRKFPECQGLTPQNSMGFVEDWRDLELWRT